MKLNLFLFGRVQTPVFAASLGLAILPASADAFPAPQWMQGGDSARITGVACSPDGTMIASSSEDGTVKLWSTNGTLIKTLNTQPCPTHCTCLVAGRHIYRRRHLLRRLH